MSYSVEDLQTERIVTVDGEQMDGNRLVRGPMSIRTSLAADTVQELHKITGDAWLVYNIKRIEKPDVIANNISAMIKAFPPTRADPKFLDFGCGFGASTLAIARMGWPVVGVDSDSKLLRLAERICADCRADDLVTLVEHADTANLPFADGEFDGVVASGVFEHIRHQERAIFAAECWRVIRPGGVLYVLGSPNRLWPVDGHTTGLPLVHWLPKWAAVPIVRRLCRRLERTCTWEELLDEGLVGVNVLGLLRSLPGSELCVRDGGNIRFYFSTIHTRRKSGLKRAAAGAVCLWLRLWEKPLRSIRVPIEAFLPSVNVAIRKKPD